MLAPLLASVVMVCAITVGHRVCALDTPPSVHHCWCIASVSIFTLLPWRVVAGSSGPPAPHHLAKPCCLQPRAKPIPHHHQHLLLLFHLLACYQPQRLCQYLPSPDPGDAEEGCERSSATDVAWQAFARAWSRAGNSCCAVPYSLLPLGLFAHTRASCIH